MLDIVSRVHDLKIHQSLFPPIVSRDKLFELRNNDRGFETGDSLLLRSVDDSDRYTKEWALVKVPFILTDTQYGMQDNHVCMSIILITHGRHDEWKSYKGLCTAILGGVNRGRQWDAGSISK